MLEWFDLIYPKLIAEADKPIECIQEAGEILYLVSVAMYANDGFKCKFLQRAKT